jgi:hypothetical protein
VVSRRFDPGDIDLGCRNGPGRGRAEPEGAGQKLGEREPGLDDGFRGLLAIYCLHDAKIRQVVVGGQLGRRLIMFGGCGLRAVRETLRPDL